jgi:type II secretory pathway pseudopilin PulG
MTRSGIRGKVDGRVSPSGCRGLSSLEVLVGLALFAVVAAGLGVASVGATRTNSTSNNVSVASALIYDKIEQLRALDPSANPADIAAGTHTDASSPMTPLGAPGGRFTRTWVITPNTPRVGLSEAVVTVTWNESSPRSARGVTYICSSASCS